jgi:hypothetical protein
MVDYLRQYIEVTNKNYNNYELDFTKVPELLKNNWVISWFKGILPIHKFITLVSFSSIFLFFIKTSLQINFKKLRILFFLLFLMAFAWFFSAPSPRFGYGVLIILTLFPVSYFGAKWFPAISHKILIVLVIITSCIYLSKLITPFIKEKKHLLYPFETVITNYSTIRIKELDFHIPDSTNDWIKKCYTIKLPCICQENIYLEPRGKRLKEGFRMKQRPDSIFIRNYKY